MRRTHALAAALVVAAFSLSSVPSLGAPMLARDVDRAGIERRSASVLVAQSNGCPCSVWDDTAVPAIAAQEDRRAVELGIKFQSGVAGYITGVRFYKSSQNVGSHIGNLWSSSGTLLASATFSGETASGWQQVSFATPVPIAANTTYIASYHTDVGFYAVNHGYFASAGVVKWPLRLLRDGEEGPNGVFKYGASSFPDETYQATNYWVDPVFMSDQADVSPPAIGGVRVAAVSATDATITWSTDEPADSQVEYGTTTAYGSLSALGPNGVTAHSVRLSGLQPNTGYHFRVLSKDVHGNPAVSTDFTYTTNAAPPDPTASPTVPPSPTPTATPTAPPSPTPTATPTAPPNPTGPSGGGPRATPTPTSPSAQPSSPAAGGGAPRVRISAVPAGAGRLQVTVIALTSAETPNNRLQELRFRGGVNALVDIEGQSGRIGEFTVALRDRPQQLTFHVRRASGGQASQVPFIVVDSFGEHSTFVGGGPNAF